MTIKAWGLDYQEVVSLAWLSYKGSKPRTKTYTFPNVGTKWTVTDVADGGDFHAITAKGGRSNQTVVALAGTDGLNDFDDNIIQGLTGCAVQYMQALNYVIEMSPDVVVGHSLGGGMASYVSIFCGKKCATVNPAPLNLNAINRVNIKAHGQLVVNYVVWGEVLGYMDDLSSSMDRVGRFCYVGSSGSIWNPISRHQITNLTGFVPPK
ncbi:MAG: hypothetical protein R2747_16540 [Pyrinomonadaceae bacterium]